MRSDIAKFKSILSEALSPAPLRAGSGGLIALVVFLAVAWNASYNSFLSKSVGRGALFTRDEPEYSILTPRFLNRGPQPPPEEVAIIGIDDESLKQLGTENHSKIDRLYLARLIDKLRDDYRAKGVVFDLIFEVPWSSEKTDETLAAALASMPTAIARYAEDASDPSRERRPLPRIAQSAKVVGNAIFPLDAQVIRRFRAEGGAVPRPSLAEAGASLYAPVSRTPGDHEFINYYGSSRTLHAYPLWTFFTPGKEPPKEALEGKVVFVGEFHVVGTPGTFKDSFATPLRGDNFFGVEIQATAAANIIRGDWIHRLPPWLEFLVLSLMVGFSAWLLVSLSPFPAFLALLVIEYVWYKASVLAFGHGFFLPGVIAREKVLPNIFMISVLLRVVQSTVNRAVLLKALSSVLDSRIAKEISDKGEVPRLGGAQREVALLFSDLADFTPLVEERGGAFAMNFLNKYLGVLTSSAKEKGGLILKSSGDSMFAIFGEFLGVKNPCARAIETAIEIERKLKVLRDAGEIIEARTRFGIHFGSVVIGNVGSEERFDFTAIGDAANTGSRLEGMNRFFGTSIIVSELTLKKSAGAFDSVFLGRVSPKGKEQALDIHAVFALGIDETERGEWNAAVGAFQKREWEKAKQLFISLAESAKTLHIASKFYVDQCQARLGADPSLGLTETIRFLEK